MKYALLIYSRPGSHEALPDAEREAVFAEYMAIYDDERVFGGAQLHPAQTARSVRVDGGEALVTDGPFADTKEVFGGYFLVDVADEDAALEIAARIPAARLGGVIEVRAVVDRDDHLRAQAPTRAAAGGSG